MTWTYILECRDGTYHVGSTDDLERRVAEHNFGLGTPYTRLRRRRPVKLAWAAEFAGLDEASAVERRVRRWSRDKRQALIEGRLDLTAELRRLG
jgi:putative endonuclease